MPEFFPAPPAHPAPGPLLATIHRRVRRRRQRRLAAAALTVLLLGSAATVAARSGDGARSALSAAAPTASPTQPTAAVPVLPRPAPSVAPAGRGPAAPPACSGRQLRVEYRSNQGLTGGSLLAFLVVRNTGPAPCALVGTVRITPVDAAGRALLPTLPLWRPPTPAPVLSVRPAPPGPAAATEDTALIPLVGVPADVAVPSGACPAGQLVTPASWLVATAGAVWVIPNRDTSPDTNFAQLSTCGVPFTDRIP